MLLPFWPGGFSLNVFKEMFKPNVMYQINTPEHRTIANRDLHQVAMELLPVGTFFVFRLYTHSLENFMSDCNQEHLAITHTDHPSTPHIHHTLEPSTEQVTLCDSHSLPNRTISTNTPDLTIKTIGYVFKTHLLITV